MRKQFTFYVFAGCIFFMCACGNDVTVAEEDSAQADTIHDLLKNNVPENKIKEYALTDTIVSDLNGDGLEDVVEFVVEESIASIQITLGGEDKPTTLKCETEDGEYVSDFSWASNWGLHTDSVIHTVDLVDGVLQDGEMLLENPAIKLWQDGGGSGFFTFKGGKWIWMTTGC